MKKLISTLILSFFAMALIIFAGFSSTSLANGKETKEVSADLAAQNPLDRTPIIKTYTTTVKDIYKCKVYYKVFWDGTDLTKSVENKYPDGFSGTVKMTKDTSENEVEFKMTLCDVNGITPYLFVDVKDRKGYTCTGLKATKTTGTDYGIVSGSGGANQELPDQLKNSDGELWVYMGLANNRSEITLQWRANTYTIKYNSNGGTGSLSNTSATYDKSVTLRSNSSKMTKTGYTFAGWNTKKDGTGTSYANAASVKNLTSEDEGTVTLYAKWTPISYTIKYNGNGATSGSMNDTSAAYDTAVSLTNNSFVKTGYQFIGWGISSGAATATCSNGASVKNLTATSGAVINLYALWKANTYTVSYNGNGATGGSMSDSAHTYDTAKSLSPYGYKQVFSVSYQGNSGKVYDGTGQAVAAYNQSVSSSFNSWNVASAGDGKKYSNLESVLNLTATNSGTVNLYAQWTDSSITLPSGIREGYDFLGWSKSQTAASPDSGFKAGDKVTITADATLYAVWKLKTYAVIYDSNGGSGTMQEGTKIYGQSYQILENEFKREGYDFIGWSTNPDLDVLYEKPEYQPGDSYDSNQEITLYAIWAQRFYVAYIGNEQSLGNDFIDSGEEELGISQGDAYRFSDNVDVDGQEIFSKEKKVSYTDGETGEEVFVDVTYTVVGWKFGNLKGVERVIWKLNGEISTNELLSVAKLQDAITYGCPNEDFGTFSLSSNYQMKLQQEPFVNLYAIWDEGPLIQSYDLYYTLDDAKFTTDKQGITIEEILKNVEVIDNEDSNFIKTNQIPEEKEADTTYVTLSDYDISKFTGLDSDASIPVNVSAEDSVGNVTDKQITIHIIDSSEVKVEETQKIRFINEKYYNLPYEQGGLSADSLWLTDESYKVKITNAFSNINNEKPRMTYQFGSDEVKKMQAFVSENGIGNCIYSDAISRFVSAFL